jgi:hypothetical protein
MKRTFSLLLMACGLGAQSTAKLDADLSGLATPGAPIASIATRVTDDILALAEKDAQPSRQTTLDFSVELAKILAGKAAAQPKVQAVDAAILEVLQSSGTASYRFHAAVDHFQDALIALNVTPAEAKRAASRLTILGQEVRGPEDIKIFRILQTLRAK